MCVCVCVCLFSNGNYEIKANLPSTTVFLPGTISKETGNKNMSDSYVPSRYFCVVGVREDWELI